MKRKNRTHPGRFDVTGQGEVWTVRKFDATYTAPFFGFASDEDYYYRASSMRVIDRVSIPALVITAEDDPFVPATPFRDPKVTSNRNIELVVTPHGGHCGFVADSSAGSDGYWAEEQIVDFAVRVTGSRT